MAIRRGGSLLAEGGVPHLFGDIGNKEGAVKEFMCPVCRAVTSQPDTTKSVGEWASNFPRSAISVTAEANLKVDRYCDACRYDGESTCAEIFCVVCDKGLCNTCSKVHRKAKSTRDHKLISIDELTRTLENPMRFAEGFGCPDHQKQQTEYYCHIHDAVVVKIVSFSITDHVTM
ncbi:hypothetical protein CHS0354_012749 [Potamilus streckersoni]|uniref:B box-type domain-containing protein n=1 Tax=Potamilus streckersoni TaxID=2493646 RepID=A0AAE0RV54_9BIVA|nr:hypothetical protein CHS0354_012749 [Potamilus streckersoni]